MAKRIQKNNSLWKISLWIFLSVVSLLFLLIASLPTWMSTPYGREQTLSWINHEIDGKIKVKNWKLGWLTGQKIDSFELNDQAGNSLVTVNTFSTDASLWSFLWGAISKHYYLGKTTLIAPYLDLVETPEGLLNVEKALQNPKKKPSKKKNKKRFHSLPLIHGDLSLLNGEVHYSAAKIEPILLKDISVKLNDRQDLLAISFRTKQGTMEGSIVANGNLNKNISLHVNAYQFPLAILDQLLETPIFTEGFGKTINLDVTVEKNPRAIIFNSTIQSTNIRGSFEGRSQNGRFYLNSGGKITWAITPSFFKEIIEKQASTDWSLARKTDVQLLVQQLEFPFSALQNRSWKDVLFQGTLALERAEIANPLFGHFSINRFFSEWKTKDKLALTYHGQINSDGGSTPLEGELTLDSAGKLDFGLVSKNFPVPLLELFTDDSVYLTPILGQSLDLMILGSYENKNLESTVSLSSPTLALQGNIEGPLNQLQMKLKGELYYSSRYTTYFGPPPSLDITAQGGIQEGHFSVTHINAQAKNPYWILTVAGTLGESGQPFDFQQVQLQGEGKVWNMPVESAELLVNSGTLFFDIDGSKNCIQSALHLETTLKGEENARPIDATIQIKNYIKNGKISVNSAEMQTQGNFSRFPVSIFSTLFDSQFNLRPFLGPVLDFEFQGRYAKEKSRNATFDIDARGQGFRAQAALSVDGAFTISQQKPAFIQWEMTPARYQALMRVLRPEQEPHYVLTRPAVIDLSIAQFLCPSSLLSTFKAFMCQSGFVGDLQSEPLHFKSRYTQEEIALVNVNCFIQGTSFSQVINLQGNGKVVSPIIPVGQSSGFAFNAEMLGFFTPEGAFHREGTVKGSLDLDLIPVREFTGILPLEHENRLQIQAVLGPFINARIYGEVSQLIGPVTADVKSSNLKVVLPIYLGAQGITLRENVEAELTLTEEVNESFLKDVTPLLITGAWSDHPIKIYVNAEGFFVPLYPMGMQGVQVKSALIDLGKVRVKNGGPIQALMQFLKARDVTEEGVMEAWFTPIYLSIVNGVAYYQRFDSLLGGNVHIALWGKIDLNKDKVKMTLGISPATLHERFNVSGISKREMFQVKMRGSTEKLELDWSSAYGRIGVLIAKSAGGIGNLIGGLIEGIVTALGEEETPSPTTYPFPWEIQH